MLTVRLLAARVLEAAMLIVRSLVVLLSGGSHVNGEVASCACLL